MSKRHFDVIILGESLAARVAAVLLARQGKQVLSFTAGKDAVHPWILSSGALERLLDLLGDRSCVMAAVPFQVITPGQRVEVHGPFPLEEELRREFPSGHPSLLTGLKALEISGARLERHFRQTPILPLYGLGSRIRFSTRGLLRRLSGELGRRPLRPFLDSLPKDERLFVEALFAGLAMAPARSLTWAEAALLWSCARRPVGISQNALDRLLQHRYEQFHGQTQPLSQIQGIETQGGRLTGLTLRNGRRCTADIFVLGDPELPSFLPEEMHHRAPAPPRPLALRFQTEGREISPLLASRVILAGKPPVRLSLRSGTGPIEGLLQVPAGEGFPSNADLASRLCTLLPFAHPDTGAVELKGREPGHSRGLFSAPSRGARLPGKLLWCCGEGFLPFLGAPGEILLGFSTAALLQGKGTG